MAADTVMAPVHPGEILLEEFLKPLAVSQYKLAKEIGAPPPLASEMWANRLLRVTALPAGPWNESWNEATSAACNQCNASTETGLSMQAARPVRRAVLMVRRRSTVRFRKGAPQTTRSSLGY
jgi:hypothetical protein